MTRKMYNRKLKVWLSYGRVLPTFIKDYVEELEKKLAEAESRVNKVLQ